MRRTSVVELAVDSKTEEKLKLLLYNLSKALERSKLYQKEDVLRKDLSALTAAYPFGREEVRFLKS